MQALRAIKAGLNQTDLSDEYLCVSVSLVFVGAWCIHPPSALIVLGTIFGGLAVLQGRAA